MELLDALLREGLLAEAGRADAGAGPGAGRRQADGPVTDMAAARYRVTRRGTAALAPFGINIDADPARRAAASRGRAWTGPSAGRT